MSNNETYLNLIKEVLNGKADSLNELIKLNQDYIYNISRSMFLNPIDSEDVTQEVLIKIISNLSKYNSEKSAFRTWIYKITVNHILSVNKKTMEGLVTDLETYGQDLDKVQFRDFQKEELSLPETKVLIEEAKLSCSMGMLLCLDRSQRAIFILGEIFKIPHKEAAEIFEITPDNFRQKLSRARRDLFQFMENKCGLINKNNPCRCEKKTLGFIEAG